MAITWGGTSGYLQLGIDVLAYPGRVRPDTQSVRLVVVYYIRAAGYGHNFSDTLRLGGRITGSQGYSFSSPRDGWTSKEIARREVTIPTSTRQQTVTFSASTGPVWNGGTPSVSRSHVVGARGYAPPRPPRDPLAAWQRDGLTRVSWAGDYDSASGLQPWSGVSIRRWKLSEKRWEYVARVPWHVKTWDDVNAPVGEHTEYDVQAYNDAGWSPIVWAGPVNTRPLPPSGVRAVKTGSDITVSWSVPDYAGYFTGFTVYDNGSKVGDASGDAREWTHVNPSATGAHVYTVTAWTANNARNTVSAGLKLESERSAASNTVAILARPYAPQDLSPSGVTVALEDLTARLSWRHNPADASTQSYYQVRYRWRDGSWNTTSITKSTAQQYRLPLSGVGRVEWQVRSWGSYKPGVEDGASPWSAVSGFTVENRPAVNVTAPSAGEYDRSRLTVEWSYLQEQGSGQAGAKITVVDTADGSVLDSGVVQGAVSRYAVRRTVQDEHEYRITVQVRSESGLWSDTASVTVQVKYAQPPTPVVSVSWDEASGMMSVQIMNPAGEPETVSNTVERSVDDGATWELVADGLPVQATVTDSEALSTGTTRYRVTATSALPSSSTVTVDAEADSGAMWIGAGAGYADAIRLPYNPEVSFTPSMPGRETYRFAGRVMRVMVDGTGVDRSWQLAARLIPGDESNCSPRDVDRVALTPGPVCYRNPDGVRIYAAMGSPTLKRGTGGVCWDVSCELVEVEQ